MEGDRGVNRRKSRGDCFHVRNHDLRLEVEDSDVTDDATVALIGGSHLSVEEGKNIEREGRGLVLGCWLARGLLGWPSWAGSAGRAGFSSFFVKKTFFSFSKTQNKYNF